MAEVQLERISVRFGAEEILKDVSFRVDDGELCVVVGPSGCGKTVTLRVVAGLTRPTSGQVFIDGQPANDVRPRDRDVAMVFQTYALYPDMTVRENWTFPLRAINLPANEIEARVGAMSRMLHMEALLDRYPNELSGGQQQRVATGRALVRRPRIFLLDEPLGNLDAKLRVEQRANIKKLQMDLGITMIYVTHDQVEAQAVGDKMVVMDVGTVQQVGTPEEIYEQPKNLFVASFIGTPSMNFLDGTLHRENGRLYVSHPHFRLPIPPAKASAMGKQIRSEAVVLGVRPEAIDLSPAEVTGGIPAVVYVIEPQSNEVIVDLKLGDEIIRMREDREELGFEPALNQRVFMTIEEELIHIFDKQTGERVV